MPRKLKTRTTFAVSEGVDIIYLEGQNEKGKKTYMLGSTLKMGLFMRKTLLSNSSLKTLTTRNSTKKSQRIHWKLDKLSTRKPKRNSNALMWQETYRNQRGMLQTLKLTVSQVPTSKSTLKKREHLTKSRLWLKTSPNKGTITICWVQ